MEKQVNALEDILAGYPTLLVAYSGGVDSAYLLHAAHQVLGAKVRGVLADSPSLPRHEYTAAVALATDRGWPLEVITTNELDDPRYAANPLNRCYYCKHELFQRMEAYARHHAFTHLAYGENADDAHEWRPGQQAAAEFQVLAPLREAGLTKAKIRALSRLANLPVHDKPAAPCLSSRVTTGLPVTREVLAKVEKGEEILHHQGFRIARLRHHGTWARVQVSPDEHPRLMDSEMQSQLTTALSGLGFTHIEFDPEPYAGASLR
jgi:pyridinium-3,5-biscarboxylic acid mononucleotide sulfurtransferase